MVSWKKLVLLPFLLLAFSGCLSLPENAGSDEMTPETASEDVAPESSASSGSDEFSDFNDSGSAASDTAEATVPDATTQDTAAQPAPEPAPQAGATDEFSEFEQAENQTAQQPQAVEAQPTPEVAQNEQQPQQNDEFNLDETPAASVEPAPVAPVPAPQPSPTQMTSKLDELDPFATPQAVQQPVSVQTVANIKIKSIQYKANDSGGAILVQADGPISFTTRNNPETEQLIVEIPGAQLPDRLKRPFNMRDIKGMFGSLDPYQEKGSNVARFVVQLRPNASDPFVTAEGDTLLIVADKSQVSALTAAAQNPKAPGALDNLNGNTEKILTSRTLQEFLTQNSKFYGKKISIETSSMNVREALRFISEEGGVNMVIADNINGNVSLKLRDVPWDQAFVIIMQARNLGYVRQGNVLRVASLDDLRKEEDAAIKLSTERIKIEPLVVKVYSVNYAKVDDMATKIKDFLTERGKVVGDVRTNTIVVTDIQQSLDRVSQLIQNLDTQPPQVLIEGRIIEASDEFQRQVGINWGFSGGSLKVGNSKQGDVNLKPSLQISNGLEQTNKLGFTLGTLDIFGQLNATLHMAENENKIRILSSPRIVTLSNEKATINQTIQRPYITPGQVQPGGGVTPPTIIFKNLELILDVTPQITSDASVIMAIKVKRDLVGATVNQEASIETREANTKVMVKNGQTSVIGGVYQNDSNDTITGVPWLKDIPVLGTLFRYKDVRNRRTELMIFLTPRIVSAGSDSISKSTNN